MNRDEVTDFINTVLITLQLWGEGKFEKCPLGVAYIQINMLSGRIDRITESLKVANTKARGGCEGLPAYGVKAPKNNGGCDGEEG